MQGQRSTVQFFPETLENSAAADRQQNFWNNPTNNSTHGLNVSEYFRARSDASMSYGHRGFHLDDGYGRWNSSEPPPININSYGGSELADNGWMAPSTAYGHPFSIDSRSTGAQRASTSGSSSYSGAFVEDCAGYPSDDADGCRFLDDRHHSSKRRSLEGPSGQSSGSSSGLNIAGSTEPDSEYPSFNNVAGNLEAFHGDFNPGHQFDGASPQLWSPGNSMHSWPWPSQHHSSSSMNPFVRVTPSMSSQQSLLPTMPAVPQMGYPMPWNGSSTSRIGSSTDIHLTSRRETNTRGVERSSIPEHLAFAPTMEMRRMRNENMIGPGDAGGHFSFLQPFSGVLPPVAPSWMPHQGLTDHASSSSAAASRPGVDLRTAHQQLRSAFLMGRRSNATGAPVTLHSRHARNMMIFEQIRNALELMQREESMMIDDVAVMDESEYLDNYRDWRLDVDNMSYEELLALEERIGNVSTGLDEGTVLKKMKRRKYLSFAACKPESCCICQEDYVNGEDLGVLSCGHDFHASCVGKWLIQKNICPICKITALSM